MKYRLISIVTVLMLCAAALVSAQTTGTAAAYGGPGLFETTLYAGKDIEAGVVKVWNSPKKMMVQIRTTEEWLISEYQIYVGTDPIPTTKKGSPIPGKFPYKGTKDTRTNVHTEIIDLKEDLDFSWGSQYVDQRIQNVAIHVELVPENGGNKSEGAWAYGPEEFEGRDWGWWYTYELAHPMRGHFIDAPVIGMGYRGPTQEGVTADSTDEDGGGFLFFPDETIEFSIGTVSLGSAVAVKKVSPLDLFPGAGSDDPRVINVARLLQSLDNDQTDGKIAIRPVVVGCLDMAMENLGLLEIGIDWTSDSQVEAVIGETIVQCEGNPEGIVLEAVSAEDAQGNLEAGLNASGIFRKNISKTEEWGETKQKMDVIPVYFPGVRSNGDPSYCDLDGNGLYDQETDQLGVPYEEWRLNGDPGGEECDPRVDGEACVITLIECREVAKPIVVTYMEQIDLLEAKTDFNVCGEDLPEGTPCRFAHDIYTAISRDDGTTWKRMNVSRMADLSSFELETGEAFPGTTGSPYLKVNDNKILVVWESKFCKSGNPRYSITTCDDPDTDVVETPETGCQEICRGNPDNGTEVCEPDYPYDDDYFVTDIWGVRGQQRSVNYDEVDDVADLGIGEIPYSCLWAARGVIVTQQDLDQGTFDSLIQEDDPETEEDESKAAELGDIIWFKPERLTSGRRDVYIPAVGSARGGGFAIAWQEDPTGLRPGKGKGPGQGWSGAISNHKTDIWYSYITYEDFAKVDGNFVPGGPGDDPNGEASFDERPGLGRPKALVPFSLPVRVSDNDMVNTHTLKVEPSSTCVTPPGGTDPICFPKVVDGTFVPLDEQEIAQQFCDHPDADPATCCDPDNHENDPNCEDLKGLFGNLSGTKRYAYLAKTLDEIDNATGKYLAGGDGVPDYQYYEARGGTLDLCNTSGDNSYMDLLPGTEAHERWYGFTNAALASKLVCVSSDGRLLDGDVSASRPNIQMQPYTKADGTKSAWVLLGYEESKGQGHSLAASEHDNPVDEIVGVETDDKGQEKPIKQDLGKNVIYHSFDYTQPDLVDPGHIVNLPALCGGLYPTYCDDPKTPDVIETNEENPTCTCEAGQPVPLYFDYFVEGEEEGTGEWLPDDTQFMQFRTEIARRVRFIAQSYGKMGPERTAAAIIYKQGQEGQGRPADVFIRRIVVPPQKSASNPTGFNPKVDNPFAFENFECTTYLDETFDLPGCPTDGVTGYNCNVWGEAYGDHLCGGVFTDPTGGYTRRDHVNLTSADIELAVDAGPLDDTPDDPTDDRYGTNKVLLWSQDLDNLGDESYGLVHEDGTGCDVLNGEVCPGMYSNARSHRGFIRGDFMVTAYAYSPNWASGRNGNDRYNFYIRRSFDGGQTWTTTPADLGGTGAYYCPEYRTDPSTHEAPDVLLPDGVTPIDACVDWCPPCPEGETCDCVITGAPIAAGQFQPAQKISQFDNNKETSSDPRVGATPPTFPLDGRDPTLPILRFVEDEYVDNIFFVAWGAGENIKSTGGTTITPEAPPTDLYYTRSVDYGDHFLKVPWVVNGDNSNYAGETVWRYERLAWGDPEQGECQLRATSDGSKVYAIYHQMTPVEGDPDEELTRWYPWEPEESHENDLWFRRVIFWPDEITTP